MEERTREQTGSKMARWAEVMPWFDRWLQSDDAVRMRLLDDLHNDDPQLHTLLLRAIQADSVAEAAHFLEVGW
jgi:hypothetical protein